MFVSWLEAHAAFPAWPAFSLVAVLTEGWLFEQTKCPKLHFAFYQHARSKRGWVCMYTICTFGYGYVFCAWSEKELQFVFNLVLSPSWRELPCVDIFGAWVQSLVFSLRPPMQS